MSIERDIEMMDGYLSNRLSDADRIAFEQKLEADPALKSEFVSQQSFIEGIKKARIAELKNIMNNTPIAPVAGVETTLALKVAALLVAIGIVGGGIYWYTMDEKEAPQEAIVQNLPPVESTAPAPEEKEVEEEKVNALETVSPEMESADKTEVKKESKPSIAAKVKQPKLDVYDPTKEVKEELPNEAAVNPLESAKKQKTSALIVETDNTQKKYNFHYQFQEGKLILLGTFDTTLYEILEFFADDKRTIFLYYTGSYYLLDEKKSKPTPLAAIEDTNLLQKLETYRAN